jgi:hypothetical protein
MKIKVRVTGFDRIGKMALLIKLVFGLFPSPGILESRKHDVRETGAIAQIKGLN